MSTLSPTTVTLSPTAAPTEGGGGVSIVTWVFFALFLFLLIVSRYLAKLVIALTKGLPIADPIKYATKKYLEKPLFLGFVALFLYLSLVVFFPIQNPWINIPLYWIVKLICWIVIFIACLRVTQFALVLIEFVMTRYGVEKYIRRGVIEFLGIVRLIALVIIFVVLIVSFTGNTVDTTRSLSIFGNINVVTATLVVMFSPIFRSLAAGLTVLSDRFVKGGQAVELYGVTPIGRVLAVQLRETRIKSFKDGAVLHVPNLLFSRYASVNGSIRSRPDAPGTMVNTTKVQIRFPISYESDVTTLRALIFTQAPHQTTVVLNDDLVLTFEKTEVPLTEAAAERTRLMLDVMELLQKHKIQLRY